MAIFWQDGKIRDTHRDPQEALRGAKDYSRRETHEGTLTATEAAFFAWGME